MIRVFIGFDPREAVAFHVCADSIIRNSSQPVSITPLYLPHFRKVLGYDELHTDGSNSFIYSRFLVPALCDFQGWALFLDGDMLVKGDIADLWAMRDPYKDVMVVQHDYKTKAAQKYLGAKNEDYPRKNWSSVILWNCGNFPNRRLSPEFVASQTGAYLHRFQWIDYPERIGALPKEWNWLVDEYPHNDDAKLLHYTLGGPYFHDYANCDHAADWNAARQLANHCEQREIKA